MNSYTLEQEFDKYKHDVRKIMLSAIKLRLFSFRGPAAYVSLLTLMFAVALPSIDLGGNIHAYASRLTFIVVVLWYVGGFCVAIFRDATIGIGRKFSELANAEIAATERTDATLKILEEYRHEVESTRPFLLDNKSKILTYQGRRNVAFGVDTINRVFHAFIKYARSIQPPDKCLFQVGYAAGHQFALDFNKDILIPMRNRTGIIAPTFEEVRNKWELYDDNVGFGDINMSGLACDKNGPHGFISVSRLFTSESTRLFTTSPLPDRCSWMAGYIAGFLNNVDILKPKTNHMVKVEHTRCARSDNTLECVFEVSTVPGNAAELSPCV